MLIYIHRKNVVEQVNQLIEAYIHLAALPASSDVSYLCPCLSVCITLFITLLGHAAIHSGLAVDGMIVQVLHIRLVIDCGQSQSV